MSKHRKQNRSSVFGVHYKKFQTPRNNTSNVFSINFSFLGILSAGLIGIFLMK